MGSLSGRVRIVRLFAAALLTVIATTACEPSPSRSTPQRSPLATPTEASSRLIGLVATMSGDDSWRGKSAFEGADLGVHKLNTALPEGEKPFELVVRDDGGDPARAVASIRELAAIEQVRGIVFAGPPEALPETEPSLAEAGIPALLAYGDLYGARLLRPHLFQVSPSLSVGVAQDRLVPRPRSGIPAHRTHGVVVVGRDLRGSLTSGRGSAAAGGEGVRHPLRIPTGGARRLRRGAESDAATSREETGPGRGRRKPAPGLRTSGGGAASDGLPLQDHEGRPPVGRPGTALAPSDRRIRHGDQPEIVSLAAAGHRGVGLLRSRCPPAADPELPRLRRGFQRVVGFRAARLAAEGLRRGGHGRLGRANVPAPGGTWHEPSSDCAACDSEAST